MVSVSVLYATINSSQIYSGTLVKLKQNREEISKLEEHVESTDLHYISQH